MLVDRLPDTVTVLRPGASTTNAEGDSTATDSETEYPGWLQQTEATEVNNGRTVLTSGWLLFLPADADLRASDRVRVDDNTFEVVGLPNRLTTPRGVHHIEARLSLVSS